MARLLPVGAMALAGLVLRAWVLVASQRLSADEAIPGLMARHILYRAEWPVFYWGQAYFGAAEAYLIAALFALFGFHAWLVFVPALLASVALIPLTWAIAEHLGPSPAGPLAAVPVALPPPILSRVLGNAGGGFALGFALQLAALLFLLRALRSCPVRTRWLALFSLSTGLAAWVWQPSLIALPPLLVAALLRAPELRRADRLAVAGVPLAVGLAPMVAYNVSSGWPTVSALLIKYSQTLPMASEPLTRQLQQLGALVLTTLGGGEETFGGSNPIQSVLLAAALVATPAIALMLALRTRTRHATADDAHVERCVWHSRLVGLGLLLTMTALNVLAAHGGVRYLVPLFLAACALCGAAVASIAQRMVRLRWLLPVLLAGVFLSNLAGYTRITELMAPEQLSMVDQTQAAVAVLEERGLTTGYADYWTAYPVTYLSAERITVAPTLAFDASGRIDRYPSYTQRVDSQTDPRQLFVLVEQRCAIQPYLQALDAAGAAYQVEPLARWLLVFNIRPAKGAEALTLDGLRSAIAGQQTC
jgi:4-amino-4-deoxy-L-arabinose transferase-like glycosyltransferase